MAAALLMMTVAALNTLSATSTSSSEYPTSKPTSNPITSNPITSNPTTLSPATLTPATATATPTTEPPTPRPTIPTREPATFPQPKPSHPPTYKRAPTESPTRTGPTRSPTTLSPLEQGKTRNPTTITPTTTPTTMGPTTGTPSQSPTTMSPTTRAPTWHSDDINQLHLFPARLPIFDCPPSARVVAYHPENREVIAKSSGFGTRETKGSCWLLQKHIECLDFPRLCKQREQDRFEMPPEYTVFNGVAEWGEFVLGGQQLTVSRGLPGRYLINSKSWLGHGWHIWANVSRDLTNNLIWKNTMYVGEVGSKYHIAAHPAGCPPQVWGFARALDLEVPLLVHGSSPRDCVEVSGHADCFQSPVTSSERSKLGEVCKANPSHLFCDYIPKWFNKTRTIGSNPVFAQDMCMHPQTGGMKVEVRAGDQKTGFEIRSASSFLVVRDPWQKLGLSLNKLIVELGRLASYKPPEPSQAPVPVPGGRTRAPTPDVWAECRPVRVPLNDCPRNNPVAMLLNTTRFPQYPPEVVICTARQIPIIFLPRPIGQGSSCGALQEYLECQQLPGCPLQPHVAMYNAPNNKTDILKLSSFQLGRHGMTAQASHTHLKIFSRQWKPRSSFMAASQWGPSVTLGGSEIREVTARVRIHKDGLLWKDYEPRLTTSVTTSACQMEELFPTVLNNTRKHGIPLLQLPSACLFGPLECFPPPFDTKYIDNINDICTKDPLQYWCKKVSNWMFNITRRIPREVPDKCNSVKVIQRRVKLSWGLGEGGIDDGRGTYIEGGKYWLEIGLQENDTTIEYLRLSFGVLGQPVHRTLYPTVSPTMSPKIPTLSPTTLEEINNTRSPTGSWAPTSSPLPDPVPYPPADMLHQAIVEISRLSKLQHWTPETYQPPPPFGIPLIVFIVVGSIIAGILGLCFLVLMAICIKKCVENVCVDQSHRGYHRSSMRESEEDAMDVMMQELDEIGETKGSDESPSNFEPNLGPKIQALSEAETQEALAASSRAALEPGGGNAGTITSDGKFIPRPTMLTLNNAASVVHGVNLNLSAVEVYRPPTPRNAEEDAAADVIHQLNSTEWERVGSSRRGTAVGAPKPPTLSPPPG